MAFSGSRAPEKREVRQEDQEEPRRPATAADQDYCQQRYSLLLIIGQTAHITQTGHIGREIERGVRSWDVDLNTCNLNLHLQEFLTCYTVSFKSAGQKCLRHNAKVLDTQVLISPSQEQVHLEVSSLLVRNSAHKLLILAGQSEEQSGDLLFHRGLFSPQHLQQILTEQFINQECSTTPSSSSKFNLTLCCPNIGEWRTTLSRHRSRQGPFILHINPPEVLPTMETLGEFTSLVSGTLTSSSTFDLLPPPTTVGFLKLSRPCCYVFPAGRGDCAFFAVNGFTVLVDGGSDTQACFWKLVCHLDRVDAVLLTHIGTENLPGVNTFLERKVAELELRSDLKDDMSKKLISPELGVVFFNAPSRLEMDPQPSVDAVLRSSQQGALTMHLLKRLEIIPQPMFRTQGVPIEPITLFQKMGVGQLDVYVLNPSKNSQEYQMFMQNWPDGVSTATKSQSVPLTALTSVSALLVWHPACPQEKVVRVLFPGVTPQTKLLQGLEKLKGLAFLQKPTVTTGDLEKLSEDKKAKRRESQDSVKSQGKEVTLKHVKERGTREENKEVSAKEKGKVGVGDKTKTKELGGKQKTASTEKKAPKKGTGKDGKKDEKTGNKEENGVIKNGQVKKDGLSSKPRNDARAKIKKESKNESKTGAKTGKKPAGKEGNNVNKTDLSNKLLLNPDAENVLEIPECKATEEQSPKAKKEPEENPCSSKTSTPEDITADVLRLREETASDSKQKSSESENEKILGGPNKEKSTEASDTPGEETAGGMMRACSVDNEVQDKTGAGDKDGAERQDQTGNVSKPANVVGFPAPLNKTPKSQRSVQLDLTPTEYTLLDGALKHSPPSRSSPGNQVPVSPDEETVEPTSPDSRPNSAGHTPYCLSPDDVWCNRVTLSKLQAQMSSSDESPDVNQTNVSSRQPCQSRTNTETQANPREKHLSFLSLGTFKETSSDPSPSVATTTTTTTHSMPAEVSSPQSTEVDESLSMSFEQGSTNVSQRESDDSIVHSHSNGTHFVGMSLGMKKPPRSLGQGSDPGRPPAPSSLHFELSPHEVDLCLVSPCEFKHFKPPESGESCRGNFAPHHYCTNNNYPKDTSPSESNAPVCTEDCPSTTADGALDSDEDESCSEPTHSPRDLCASQALPSDPLPVPLRDSPPLPPHPDTSMPVPQSNLDTQGKRLKASSMVGKKMPGVVDGPNKSGSGKKRTGSQSGVSSSRTPSFNSRSAPAKSSPNTGAGSKTTSAGEVSVYVDLAYVPSGASSSTVNVDFFKCVRSSCYIISGDSPEREELMRQTLDALFEGKMTWSDNMQVTVIPTYESVSMQEWYQQTLDRQRELGITVLGSNSTVAMQDETFPACKIEF